jgi:hypothetical protein
MKKHSRPINTTEVKRKFDANQVDFNLEVQRNSVWNKQQKGMLIHSLICDYIVPPLYFINTDAEDKTVHVLDGQQRMRSMIEFFNDEVVIPENVLPYYDEVTEQEFELSGKKFSELDEVVRKSFETTNIPSYTLSDITEEEIEECFMRLNSGTHLTNIEYIRVLGGKETRQVINKLLDEDFFKNSIKITNRQRERGKDQESILQCISVFNNFDVSGKAIKSLTMQIKNEGIQEEYMQQLEYIAHYLSTVFPSSVEGEEQNYSYLKKVNIPVIFRIAALTIVDKVDALQFFDWIDRFFENIPKEYAETTKAGSAKKENVEKRFNILFDSYIEKFNPQLKEKAV